MAVGTDNLGNEVMAACFNPSTWAVNLPNQTDPGADDSLVDLRNSDRHQPTNEGVKTCRLSPFCCLHPAFGAALGGWAARVSTADHTP